MNELPHFDPLKSIQMEKIRNHNNVIETKYLDHELNKFKNEISMTRSRLLVVHDTREHNALTYTPLDNCKLISSFSHGHECVEDFYRDSENAMLMEKRIFENVGDPLKDVTMDMIDDDIDCINRLLDTDEATKVDERYVQFEDFIEIINYDEMESSEKFSDDGRLSNCNVDLDTEIDPILEVKLVPKEQDDRNEPVLELIGKPMQQSVEIVTTKRHEKPTKINSIEDFSNEEKHLVDPNPFIITRLDVTNQPKSVISEPNECTEIQIAPEQDAIVSDLFTNNAHNEDIRRNILQKFFLRWIHFTTIEKLSKDNISCNQSRIQKIETFLNNIRLEKKKQLRHDTTRIVDVKKRIAEPENPMALAKKYHQK